ncbi:DNA-processing protein DprA [Nonomuraea sp. ATR24]|uniref:DNA-processing protein DprA n=1 Tax=Nonomuraea sp. ATR24 TaxID=1676744 RepID=UPI0035BF2B57
MHTPDHEARAALMRAADAGDTAMGRLVSHYGAVRTAEAVRAQRLPDPGDPLPADGDHPRDHSGDHSRDRPGDHPGDLSHRLATWHTRLATWHARLTAADPAADLAAGHQAGARLVIPGDPEWPTQLDQLGPGRPLGLWLHGNADLRFSCLRSAAVVGARAATPYGAHVAAQFGIGLSESGWTVISGGAIGIDAAAHRGALAADSPTVVVLACGVDIPYPAEHQPLFAAARDQGVLVSECPPGVHPTRARFLIRNRLIAALSRGTAVIEAALRSGALNTATHALTLDRHLAVVPGPITSAQSAGCHRLLREQKAVCVTSPEELIELVGTIGDDLAPPQRAPALPRDALSLQTRAVLDAIPSRGGAGPATIAVAAGVPLNTALSALGSLAAAGYVERVPKGWRIRKAPSPVYPKATPTAVDQPTPPSEQHAVPSEHHASEHHASEHHASEHHAWGHHASGQRASEQRAASPRPPGAPQEQGAISTGPSSVPSGQPAVSPESPRVPPEQRAAPPSVPSERDAAPSEPPAGSAQPPAHPPGTPGSPVPSDRPLLDASATPERTSPPRPALPEGRPTLIPSPRTGSPALTPPPNASSQEDETPLPSSTPASQPCHPENQMIPSPRPEPP